jgi:hypothetical protein
LPTMGSEAALKSGASVCQAHRARRFCCCCAPDRLQARLLRAPPRSKISRHSLSASARRAYAFGLPTMGRAAALKSCASVYQAHRARRFCCRCAPDRLQARLLRAPPRSKISRHSLSASARRAYAFGLPTMGRAAALKPDAAVNQAKTVNGVYCCSAAGRRQAELLRSSARSKI